MVKLNPVRDYVAYGTDNGFVRVERLSKAMVKYFVFGLVHVLTKAVFCSQINYVFKKRLDSVLTALSGAGMESVYSVAITWED